MHKFYFNFSNFVFFKEN